MLMHGLRSLQRLLGGTSYAYSSCVYQQQLVVCDVMLLSYELPTRRNVARIPVIPIDGVCRRKMCNVPLVRSEI